MAMDALAAPVPAVPPNTTAEPADAVDAFLRLSAALTGFDRVELLGTGMVPRYYDELTRIIGARQVGALLAAAGRVESGHPASGEDFDRAFRERILDDERFGPVARRVVTMWYLGSWAQLPREWRNTYGATSLRRRPCRLRRRIPGRAGVGRRRRSPDGGQTAGFRVLGPALPPPSRHRRGHRRGGGPVSEPVVTDDGYDVVIVGGGIAGATAAKIIADHGGKRILILEAGRATGMSADKYASHVEAYQEALAKVPNSPYPTTRTRRSPRCCPSGSCSPGQRPAGRPPRSSTPAATSCRPARCRSAATTPAPWAGPRCTGSAPACGCCRTTSSCGASTATASTGRSATRTCGPTTSGPRGTSSGWPADVDRPALPGDRRRTQYFGGATSTR